MKHLPSILTASSILMIAVLSSCSDPEETASAKIAEAQSALQIANSDSEYAKRLSALNTLLVSIETLEKDYQDTDAFETWLASNQPPLDTADVSERISELVNGPEGCVQDLKQECLKKSVAMLTSKLETRLGPQNAGYYEIESLVGEKQYDEAIASVEKSAVNPSTYQRNLARLLTELRKAYAFDPSVKEAAEKTAVKLANLQIGDISQQLSTLEDAANQISQLNSFGSRPVLSELDRSLLLVFAARAFELLNGFENLHPEDSARAKARFVLQQAVGGDMKGAVVVAEEIAANYSADRTDVFEKLSVQLADNGDFKGALDVLDIAVSSIDTEQPNWADKDFEIRSKVATGVYNDWHRAQLNDADIVPWKIGRSAFSSLPGADDLGAFDDFLGRVFQESQPAGLAMHGQNGTRYDQILAELGLLYELNGLHDEADRMFSRANDTFESLRAAHLEVLQRIRSQEDPVQKDRVGLNLREGFLALMRDDLDAGMKKLSDALPVSHTQFKEQELLTDWVIQAAVAQNQLQTVQASILQAQPNKSPEEIFNLVARTVMTVGSEELVAQYIDNANSQSDKDNLRFDYINRLLEQDGSFKTIKAELEKFDLEKATGRTIVFGFTNLAKAAYRDEPDLDRTPYYDEALKVGLRSPEEEEVWWRSAIAFQALNTKDFDIAISIVEPSDWPPAPAFYSEAIKMSETVDDLKKVLEFLVRKSQSFQAYLNNAVNERPELAQQAEEEKARNLDSMRRFFQQALEHPVMAGN